MNVKELKELLKDIPDDLDVKLWIDSDVVIDEGFNAVSTISNAYEIGTWYLSHKTNCWHDKEDLMENYEDEIRDQFKISDADDITDEQFNEFLKEFESIYCLQLIIVPE